ncbi:hypothetical protein LOK49_LG05G01838 [Camellia lanceoleosa]|uniref:Uncharacterized protein n=1 Tax=Camellia lanceoleosa TaxID=1840588 RepID=A0ACC0HN67_9ERIC|nr:hypothetical protein LOK49_LG05G01838 [Camellia lanceoleosa]
MEKKKHEVFFSTKLKLSILFIALMMFQSHGLSQGSHVDQLGQLRALWRAKRHAQSLSDHEEWMIVAGLGDGGGGEGSFEVGKMEDDEIEGGLPGQPTGVMFKQYAGGDTDAVVPVSGTRYAIDALNLSVIKPWHPWSDDTNEVRFKRLNWLFHYTSMQFLAQFE